MVVSVSFNGLQRKVTRADQIQLPVSAKTRVTEVLTYIQKRYPDIPLSEDAVLVMVNNKVSKLDQILKDNDKISFVPHIGGG
jgi:molybdopterin converting factor small subunit